MEKSTKALGYNSEFKQLEADGFKLIHMDKDERKIANLSLKGEFLMRPIFSIVC